MAVSVIDPFAVVGAQTVPAPEDMHYLLSAHLGRLYIVTP